MSGAASAVFAILQYFVSSDLAKAAFEMLAFVCFVMAANRLWAKERAATLNAEARIEELFGEYAHSLRVDRVDYEEFRQLDEADVDKIIARNGRYAIVFQNTIARPIEYEIRQVIETNGPHPITETRLIGLRD